MEDLTLIDGVVAIIIVLSALLAYARGFVRESLAILGWLAAAVVAFIFAPQVTPLMSQIPGLGGFIQDSCELGVIGAFAAVFAIALVVFSIFTPLFSSIVQRSALGGLDQGLGFLFGVARGILLVAVGFLVYNTFLSTQQVAMVEDSRSAKVFAQFVGQVGDEDLQGPVDWLFAKYSEVVENSCAAPTE